MKRSILISLSLSLAMANNTVIPSNGSELSLTIYNNNRVFVQEIRHTKVQAGKQRLIYQNVPRFLITASVVPSFSGVAVTLYSQNYSYGLISLNSMLRNSLNKEVSYYPNSDNKTLKRGVLLRAKSPIMIKDNQSSKIISLDRDTQVVFDSIPKGMITTPSLIWNIETAKAGNLSINLKYLSRGISWKSDYVLDIDEKSKKINLVGWITVKNDSGISYPNAKITCLAGDVHISSRHRRVKTLYKMMEADVMPTPKVKEESFSGYHIYKIPFKETIANKEQKQIRFLKKESINYESFGVVRVDSYPRKGVKKLQFINTISFKNIKENRLGIPLPSGIVRVYSADREGNSHFIGESHIYNSAVKELVNLKIGKLFDATGTRRISKYVARDGYRDIVSSYTLHNRGTTPLTLKIRENLPTYGGKINLKNSCSGICSTKKLSAFVQEFTIKLLAQKSYKFNSEFEVIK